MNEEYDDLDEPPARPRKDIPAADRELLELAARALGAVRVEEVEGENWVNLHFADGSTVFHWNPRVHSDDSLHLAVDLQMQVSVDDGKATVGCGGAFAEEFNDNDPRAATRLAILRVAAEVGRQPALSRQTSSGN